MPKYRENISAVVDDAGKCRQVNHYYPYGSLMGESWTDIDNDYRWEGKRLNSFAALNHYDFEARNYDPVIPGFTSIDPLCGQTAGISPYVYCLGNPIRYIDPTGLTAWTTDDPNAIASFIMQARSRQTIQIDDAMSQFNMTGWTTHQDGRYHLDTEKRKLYFSQSDITGGKISVFGYSIDFNYIPHSDADKINNGVSYISLSSSLISSTCYNANALLKRMLEYNPYESYHLWKDRPFSVRFPIRNFDVKGSGLYTASKAAKIGTAIGIVCLCVQVGEDLYDHHYICAGTRLAIFGTIMASTRIPYAGIPISIGLAIAECKWGDEYIYNPLKNMQ